MKRHLSFILILLAPLWATQSATAAAGPTPSSTTYSPLLQAAASPGAYWVGTLSVHAHANGTDEYGGTTVIDYQVSATAHTDGTVAYSGSHFQENALSDHLCRVTSTISGSGTARVPLTASLQYNLPTGGQGWFIRGTYSGRAEDPPSENYGMRGTRTYQGCGASDGVFSYESNQPPYVVAAGPASATHLEGSWTDTSIPSWVVNYSYNLTLVEPPDSCELPESTNSPTAASRTAPLVVGVPRVTVPSQRAAAARPPWRDRWMSQQTQARFRSVGHGIIGLGAMTVSAGGACATAGALTANPPVVAAGGIGAGLGAVTFAAGLLVSLIGTPPPAPRGAARQAPGVRAGDFRTIAQPVVRRLTSQPFLPVGSLTSSATDAANTLVSSVEELQAFLEAMVTALDRADDAAAAGDLEWQVRQEDAAKRYADRAATLLRGLPTLFASFQAAMTATGFQHTVTQTEFQAYQASLLANGLSAADAQNFTQLGFDETAREQVRQELLALAPATTVGAGNGKFPGSLADPRFTQGLSELGTLLAEAAKPAPNVGVAPVRGSTGGVLQTTIRARDAACEPNNQLRSVRFTRLDNATVDVPNVGTVSAVTGQAIPLTGSPASIVLTQHRLRDGQASTVALVVTDGCGDWTTFFGGGPNAF